MTPPTVVVIAPQGAGKTRYAEAIARLFGCETIVDDWDGCTSLPPGALALTNRPLPHALTDARTTPAKSS